MNSEDQSIKENRGQTETVRKESKVAGKETGGHTLLQRCVVASEKKALKYTERSKETEN